MLEDELLEGALGATLGFGDDVALLGVAGAGAGLGAGEAGLAAGEGTLAGDGMACDSRREAEDRGT